MNDNSPNPDPGDKTVPAQNADKTVPAHSVPPVSSGMYGHGSHLLQSGLMLPPQSPGVLGVIGKYQVIKILGEGGMGQVVLAREPVTDSMVAIKLIKPEFLNKSWAVHRFLTEARHMFRMSHGSIIRVLDVSDRAEGPYFVMPFMPGGSLADKIKPGEPLPAETILPVARAVAEALHHAHTRGITHRDLKPSNILLDTDGKAQLADFGLLRTFLNDTIIDTSQPQMEGTVPYMSPAVAAGKAEDTRCDIYAFGCLLYEMLTGQPPYQGPTVDAVLKQIQDGPPPPIRQLNPHAPAALTAIADHAMARELRDRYASMADVVEELERVAQGKVLIGTHGKEQSAPHGKAGGSANKRKALIAAGAVAIIGLAAFGISRLDWKHDYNPQGIAPTVPPQENLTVDLGDGVTMDFVLIHPGSFTMGSDTSAAKNEKPAHKVTLTKPYYLGKYEVTQEQWEKLMGSNPSNFKGAKKPVEMVTWNDCQYFLAKLKEKLPGQSFRLPTEAEWEYACRAGSTGDYCYGDGEDSLAEYAWYSGYSGSMAHPVGAKKPNAWGLYDMHGNVWEWCADWVGDYPLGSLTDPTGPEKGSAWVFRGGSYGDAATACRSANRYGFGPAFRSYILGFRVAAVPAGGSPAGTSAVATTQEQFTYTTENGAITITGYTGTDATATIPVTIGGHPVTGIADQAFKSCASLTNMTIPANVTIIGKEAFAGCAKLISVYFKGDAPGGGSYSSMFDGANNASVYYLPGTKGWSATYGGRPAFLPAQDFKCTTAGNAITVTKYTGPGGDVVIPDKINGLPVTIIADGAFQNCSELNSVTISNSVTTVGNWAFAGCTKLTSVMIPATVTSIQAAPFAHCDKLVSFVVDKANSAYSSVNGIIFDKMGTSLVICPAGLAGTFAIPDKVTVISPWAFVGCKKLTGITFPKSLATIGSCAFWECTGLTNIVIPSSIQTLGIKAFVGCSGLTDVTIPDSIASIPKQTFSSCINLRRVVIARSVATIEQGAFYDCQNLQEVCFDGDAPVLGTGLNVFHNVGKATIYHLPTAKGWGKEFGGRPTAVWEPEKDAKPSLPQTTGATPEPLTDGPFSYTVKDGAVTIVKYTGPGGDVVIPEEIKAMPVRTIGDYAFGGCVNLTGITIPKSVTSIRPYAFHRCVGLTSVTIPASVSTIGGYIFNGCSALVAITVDEANPAYSSVDGVLFDKQRASLHLCPEGKGGTYKIPDGVTRISRWSFANCAKLTAITIPDSVTEIGDNAFRVCTSLSTINVPSSVALIQVNAFYRCSALNAITVDTANPFYTSADGVLFNKQKTVLVSCPGGKTGNYEIPGGVTKINPNAFEDCPKLTGVTIPDSVTEIGDGAFTRCIGLTTITIPLRVSQINPGAFFGCDKLMSLEVAVANPAYSSSEDGVLFNKEKTKLVRCPPGKAGKYVVPDGITSIEIEAFGDCTYLTDIAIPDSVSQICDIAFSGCSRLNQVENGKGLRSIGQNAFQVCASLRLVIFSGDAPKGDADPTIFNRTQTTVCHLPETKGWSKTFAGQPTALWDAKLRFCYTTDKDATTLTKYIGSGGDVVIPDTIGGFPVVSIAESAFQNCPTLTSLTVPEGVKSIMGRAFDGCTGLTKVTLPASVTSLGSYPGEHWGRFNLFVNCPRLASITVDAANPAFRSDSDGILFNKEMTTLLAYPGGRTGSYTIPDSVTIVGLQAFEGCAELTEVKIHRGVTALGLAARANPFCNCPKLTSIAVDETSATFTSDADGVLFSKDRSALVCYPGGKAGAYTIPDGVTHIWGSAFASSPRLSSVTMPASVTSIGGRAFINSGELTGVYFKGNAPSDVGYRAFHGQDKTTIYYLPTTKGWGKEFFWRPTAVWEKKEK